MSPTTIDGGVRMAEAMFLVCDYCGRDALETLKIRIGQQNYLLDVCDKHLTAITSKARKPKRGRRPKSSAAASVRSRQRSTRPRPTERWPSCR